MFAKNSQFSKKQFSRKQFARNNSNAAGCIVCACLLFSILVSCGQNLYTQGRKLVAEGEYAGAANKLSDDLMLNPSHAKSWRELGVARYYLGDYVESLSHLNRASKLAGDPRTELYRGMTLEKLSRWDDASGAYTAALALKPPKQLITRIILRQRRVERRDVIARALASEESIDVDSIPLNTVAVYDFDGSRLSPELAPLALGFAEFTAIDLAKVSALTVVERVNLSLLLDELNLSGSGVVDPATAPRVGKLLGSRKVITGWVESPEPDQIRVGGVIVNTVDNTEALPESEQEQLQRLFKLQKAFVYRVLQELGVEPTDAERLAIDRIPTDSLNAFLEYCRGLNSMRLGSYAEAEGHFENAQSIDENFSEAGEQASEAGGLSDDVNFESYIQTFTAPGAPGLDPSLRNIVINTGAIPGGGGESSSPNQPPVIPTGSVLIRGNPDAD